MSLSRKHYREVAKFLDDQLAKHGQLTSVSEIAQGLADIFKKDNPNFRYDKFFTACGLDVWGEFQLTASKKEK